MLELRPGCEHCDRDLPPDSAEARICTFECTFCADCVELVLDGVCPNCGGGFVPRPVRPAALLAGRPPVTGRTHRPVDLVAHGARLAARPEHDRRRPTPTPAAAPLRLYGEPAEVAALPWPWVDRRLAEAGTYWVVPRGGGAAPHARPVWGLWEAGHLHLSIGSPAVAAALATDPAVTVHLDSGTDVVVLEGVAAAPAPTVDAGPLARYEAKYTYTYDVAEHGGFTAVAPTAVVAWRARGVAGGDGFHQAGRWTFTGTSPDTTRALP